MQATIYQIKIILEGSKPPILRRLLVSSDIPLADFHKVIQTTMGWENAHLHQFVKNRQFFPYICPATISGMNRITLIIMT